MLFYETKYYLFLHKVLLSVKTKKALGFGLLGLLASALSYVPDSQDYKLLSVGISAVISLPILGMLCHLDFLLSGFSARLS